MKSSFDTVAVALVLVLGSATPAFAQGGSLNSPTAAPPPPPPSSLGLKGDLAAEAAPAPAAPTPTPQAAPEGPTVAPTAVPPPPAEEAADEEESAEEESPVTLSIEVPVATSYVWRGTLLSSSLLKPALQPSVELGLNGLGPGAFTLGGWLNQSLTEDDNAANREVDVSASYALPVTDALELSLGYVVYLVPAYEPVDGQHEFSAVASFDTGGLSPYIGVHVDPIRLNGAYAQVGAEYGIEAGSVSIVPSLNAGVSKYEGVEFDLQDVTVSLRADVPFGESGLYATATAAAAFNGRAVEGDDEILPYGLLGLGFSN